MDSSPESNRRTARPDIRVHFSAPQRRGGRIFLFFAIKEIVYEPRIEKHFDRTKPGSTG